jgi:hypothetical protein
MNLVKSSIAFDPATSSLAARWDRWIQTWAEPRGQIGLSLFRVLFGSFMLYQLLINYSQRGFLFGTAGVWPYDMFVAERAVNDSISLYAWSNEPMWFELIYHAHLIVAGLWLLGFATTFLTPLLWLFHWSIHERFALLWDGGDNLSYLLLIYLSFANVGAYIAPLSKRGVLPFDPTRTWQVARGLVHNFAVLACTLQIALLYFNAGVAKLDGKYWQNGTALYYSLRAHEYNVAPDAARLVWDSPLLLTLGTYSTVLFQLAFPWILWLGRPWMRIVLVVTAIGFHLGILSLMGLVTFGLFMLAYEPILLEDSEYRRIEALLRRVGDFVGFRARTSPRRESTHFEVPTQGVER